MIIWFGVFLYAILLVALIYFIFLSFRLFFDKEFVKNPPFVPTFGKESNIFYTQVSNIIEKSKKPLHILDPGCGMAGILIKLAKKHPKHNFVGIELNKTIYKLCNLRCKKYQNITIINNNLFNESFNKFDVIFCFLLEPIMHDFGKKINNECKKNTVIFSNTFEIDNLKLARTYNTTRKGFIKNVYEYHMGL